ncbi:MAG: hypothetical protein OXH09_15810 [Gammaproteobacteria bacterium]|nr:hypothetical protein [Gammaproteobacteria bacterium]
MSRARHRGSQHTASSAVRPRKPQALGSVLARSKTGPPAASKPPLREFFAHGTAASSAAAPGGSGGPPARVDALAATLGCLGRTGGVAAVEVATAAPAGGGEPD